MRCNLTLQSSQISHKKLTKWIHLIYQIVGKPRRQLKHKEHDMDPAWLDCLKCVLQFCSSELRQAAKKETQVAVRRNAPNNQTPPTKGRPSSSVCSQLSAIRSATFWLAHFASDTGALQDYKNPAVLHSYTGHGKHKLPGCCLHRIAISPWISIMFWHGISTATPGFFPKNYWLATIDYEDSSPKVRSHFERLRGIVPNYLRVAA